ncbi:MAG TPA: hypothetical protein PLH07_06540 [Sulfurovum sp.]|jgi:hypothetical protein|nr:hypothetical protein [Sulfurovum sp.]HQS73041.1 hypothetical protein [Sulfurovum sp.]HQS77748.1 hypothetical protein [Sulfurovum sp.]HQT28937.1 hypothetical protein [Sulfurovum sp.]
MTRKEVMLNTVWDEFGMGTCRLFVDFFNQYIPFILFQDHKPTPNISSQMMQSINAILELDEGELESFKSLLYDAYLSQSVITQMNIVPWSKADLYSASKVKEIYIDQDNDHGKGIYAEIIIECVPQILVCITVKEGKMIGFEEHL